MDPRNDVTVDQEQTNVKRIGCNVPLDADLTPAETGSFARAREGLLSELRLVTGLSSVISTFNQGSVYKLVMVPEDGRLLKDNTGNVKGVFYRVDHTSR